MTKSTTAVQCSLTQPSFNEVQEVENALMRCAAAAKLEGGATIKRSLEIQMKNNKLKFKWKTKGALLTVCPNVVRRLLCMGCVHNVVYRQELCESQERTEVKWVKLFSNNFNSHSPSRKRLQSVTAMLRLFSNKMVYLKSLKYDSAYEKCTAKDKNGMEDLSKGISIR